MIYLSQVLWNKISRRNCRKSETHTMLPFNWKAITKLLVYSLTVQFKTLGLLFFYCVCNFVFIIHIFTRILRIGHEFGCTKYIHICVCNSLILWKHLYSACDTETTKKKQRGKHSANYLNFPLVLHFDGTMENSRKWNIYAALCVDTVDIREIMS